LRAERGTEINPAPFDGGRVTETTTPLRDETLSTKPDSNTRTPVADMNSAVTGVLSEISLPNRSEASSAEIMFLFIKSYLGIHYAMMAAKCMGLAVSDELLNRPTVSLDSISGKNENIVSVTA